MGYTYKTIEESLVHMIVVILLGIISILMDIAIIYLTIVSLVDANYGMSALYGFLLLHVIFKNRSIWRG